MPNITVIEHPKLSEEYEKRYIIINKDTGEVLDDAQGYGYKSISKAYAAYSYKNRDESKDKEKRARKKHIQKWMEEHKSFVELMDTFSFEIVKGSWGPDEKFDANFVRRMLSENNLEIDFTASELLKVWLTNKK